MNLKTRLEQLERQRQPPKARYLSEDEEAEALARLMERLEGALEVDPGMLPRTPEEALQRGFMTMADALADTLGMTRQELRDHLKGDE
jgi:hypothetical protein